MHGIVRSLSELRGVRVVSVVRAKYLSDSLLHLPHGASVHQELAVIMRELVPCTASVHTQCISRVYVGHVTSRRSASSSSMPRLQLVIFHPRRHTFDPFPFTAKFPFSSHPNPYGRRLADRPNLVQRHKRPPPRKACCSTLAQHTLLTVPHKSGLGLDHVSVGKGFYYIGSFMSLCPVFYTVSFCFRFPALHSSISSFTLGFLPSNVAAPPSPSSSTWPTSRA